MKALELKPQHFGALNGLILVFTKLRDIDSVVETLYQLDEVHPASANGIRDQLKSAVDEGVAVKKWKHTDNQELVLEGGRPVEIKKIKIKKEHVADTQELLFCCFGGGRPRQWARVIR